MGSAEQSINEEEVFDRTCGRNVQKKPIYRRGPGDSGMTLIQVQKMVVDGSRLNQGEEILRRWSHHDADRHIIWCMNVSSVEIEHSISLETRSFR